jgi:hypothetical protein
MAPVLQCPDCGERHPLSRVPTQGAFPCQGCGRVLKVPEAVGQRAAAQTAAARPVPVASASVSPTGPVTPLEEVAAPAAAATAAVTPAVDGQALGALSPRSSRRSGHRLGPVSWWMRLLLWFIAVPLAFMSVFLVARAFGFFTTNQLSDLFLANDTSRFWPVARLLPFVALVTALLVTLGVYLLARLRGRRNAPSANEYSVSTSRARGR